MTIKTGKGLWQRLLQFVIPLAAMIVMVIAAVSVEMADIRSDNDNFYVRAVVTEITEDYSNGEDFAGTQTVTALIKSGEYKGYECTLENSNTYQRGALCSEGTRIIGLVKLNEDGSISGSVYNYDRSIMLYVLLAIFIAAMIIVGGKKGARSLYALIFTFVCVVCMFVPLIYSGINGILAAIISAVFILVASIYIMHGWSKKSACAMIGTTIGVAISGGVSMILGQASSLTGYNMSDVESMVYISNFTGLNVSSILYAGILISSLGAVMDVSVSMVSSMQEVNDNAPGLTAKQLFASGMRVGKDMIGTMSNTLILAYTGSAACVLITVFAYEMPYLQIMGYNSIIIEILSGLCGTLGVILTVPVQAAITSFALKRGHKKEKTALKK